MARIAAILCVTLAAVTQCSKTHFTVYNNANCVGGAIGDNGETGNKTRELRWADSKSMTWAVDTSATSITDSQCNAIDCWVGGSTSCGISDWSMTMECMLDDGATQFQINTFTTGDCGQQINYYALTSAEFQKLGAGTCAQATATSTWGTTCSADPPPASCNQGTVSIIITGNNKPAGTFCGVTVPAPSSSGSGGTSNSSTSNNAGNGSSSSGSASTTKNVGTASAAYSPLKTFTTHVVLLIGAAKML